MKMNEVLVTEVSIRRKFSLGSYEMLDVEFTARVSEGQDPQEVAKTLDRETVRFKESRED